MGENHFAPIPTALYGAVLFFAGIAYFILQQSIIRHQGESSPLKRALGRDLKGKLSPIIYAVAIGLAFVHQLLADILYVVVALIWLVPDSRIESRVKSPSS